MYGKCQLNSLPDTATDTRCHHLGDGASYDGRGLVFNIANRSKTRDPLRYLIIASDTVRVWH
jgi:hypothetical protein